ncbi:MAG: hypothetical protein P1P88_26390, partial [Bacteroidales bacterium]|nr:hypothetical protein [Bacteroidales bacterium]
MLLTNGKEINHTLATTPDGTGEPIDVHNPLQVDGDSVYSKDVKVSISDVGTFTGSDLTTLFNNLDDYISDSSATSPKYFEIKLERPITTGSISIVTNSGNFSNVKVEFFDRQMKLLGESDDSTNN